MPRSGICPADWQQSRRNGTDPGPSAFQAGKPQRARAALDAISVRQDGRAASATTIARKRSVFANVLRYAVELGELPSTPLDRPSWRPPKVSEVVDRRVVVNPRQARELLTAVTYVGQNRRGPYARGQQLMAFYACMYFAALRPGEAVALRIQDCYLPASGWGSLTLERSRPEVNRRWTDTASAHDERGLKHRPVTDTRRVPIPPELVAILRQHINTFGAASDGRIFSSDRRGPVASTAISDVWAEARTFALTPAQVASPLARRPMICGTLPFRCGSAPEFPRHGLPSVPGTASRSCSGSMLNAWMTATRPLTRASTPF